MIKCVTVTPVKNREVPRRSVQYSTHVLTTTSTELKKQKLLLIPSTYCTTVLQYYVCTTLLLCTQYRY